MQNREAKQCIVYSIGGVVNWVMLMMHPSMIEGEKKLTQLHLFVHIWDDSAVKTSICFLVLW